MLNCNVLCCKALCKYSGVNALQNLWSTSTYHFCFLVFYRQPVVYLYYIDLHKGYSAEISNILDLPPIFPRLSIYPFILFFLECLFNFSQCRHSINLAVISTQWFLLNFLYRLPVNVLFFISWDTFPLLTLSAYFHEAKSKSTLI